MGGLIFLANRVEKRYRLTRGILSAIFHCVEVRNSDELWNKGDFRLGLSQGGRGDEKTFSRTPLPPGDLPCHGQ